MSKEPLISVIVNIDSSTHNLKKCLNTLILQTYKNLEIRCVVSSCFEVNLQILEEYKKRDSRINVLSFDTKDRSFGKNECIKSSNGEYITFVYPNDWFMLDLYDVFASRLSDIVSADIYMFNTSLYSREFVDVPGCEYFLSENIMNNEDTHTIHTFKDIRDILITNRLVNNKIYNLQFLKDKGIAFSEDNIFSDYLFNLETLIQADGIIINDEVYSRSERNIIIPDVNTEKIFDIFEIINKIEAFLRDKNLFTKSYLGFFYMSFNTLIMYYNFCMENFRYDYFVKMQETLLKQFYSMTSDSQQIIKNKPDVINLLYSSYDKFNPERLKNKSFS